MRISITVFFLCAVLLLPACGPKKPALQTGAGAGIALDAHGQNATETNASISPDADGADADLDAQNLPVVKDDAPLSPQEEQALETEPEIHFDLDAHETEEVRLFFRYFTHDAKGRKHFEAWLERSKLYLPYVRQTFAELELPRDLIFLPFVESGYNPKARSRAGAKGLWQFMPFTAKKYGLKLGWWVDERLDPFKATHAAADYLAKLYNDFGDWYLALAAYNAGEGRVGRAVKSTGCDDFFELSQKKRYVRRRGRQIHFLPKETRYYVPKFLAVLKIVRNLESLGFAPIDQDAENTVEKLEVEPKTDLLALSKAIGMDWEDFRLLNPAFLEPGSHPSEASTVYVPKDKLTQAQAHLSGPDAKPYSSYYTLYKVRRGDSWYRISRRFQVPVSVLKRYNQKTSNLIKPGQNVKVPGRGEAQKTAATLKKTRKAASAEPGPVSPAMQKTHDLAQKRSNYTVESGDSLWSLAKRYRMTVKTLAKANGLHENSGLVIGQKMYVPDQSPAATRKTRQEAEQTRRITTYKVRRGDTLYGIAKKFGVTAEALQTWNDIPKKSLIFPGENLKVYVR